MYLQLNTVQLTPRAANFDSAWLTLRQSADTAARSKSLVGLVSRVLATRDLVRTVDLASGTGANARFLIPLLARPQRWLFTDRDPTLLTEAFRAMTEWGRSLAFTVEHRDLGIDLMGTSGACRIDTHIVNLADTDSLVVIDGQDLVTASALLDLVSAKWLHHLLSRCREMEAAVLFALSYDGRLSCSPATSDDEMVRELVNRHQYGDKGFGPALGPKAVGVTTSTLESLGYIVRQETSDWMLSPESGTLQARLITEWAQAATEVPEANARAVAAWKEQRLMHVAEGRSEIVVGHQDIAAWLPEKHFSQ